ncbi:hypothetical protein Pmar_PMAR000777 [Perkinsus marinus ATCC 50983]|uniref:F-box domain-containing protein n=1 Tax=Perkinsus marinus (strain ATCC 50983 / TXsc) TaxID=423536 RepID=C5KXK8_PERM5|nr:hypothetical protein Pmar_PMAR000777 [Perkinsus marinus ATCC 50983]EER10732.1 hypothetical protein Pmar_PMAR000777 [Perkinsus marinus ATCC 50983]|eukprot:XP_002778937.1 hypothetical protein Pmar_PMAR000777 [Perkinsus marinus ATCC 50983]
MAEGGDSGYGLYQEDQDDTLDWTGLLALFIYWGVSVGYYTIFHSLIFVGGTDYRWSCIMRGGSLFFTFYSFLMTFDSAFPMEAPLAVKPLQVVLLAQEIIEAKLSAVEEDITYLEKKRACYVQQRLEIACELQRRQMLAMPIGQLPFEHIVQFLTDRDVARLSATSRHYRVACRDPIKGKLMVPHIAHGGTSSASFGRTMKAVSRLCLPSIESMKLDARKSGAHGLLSALSRLSAGSVSNLRTLRVNCAAEREFFVDNLLEFCTEVMAPNQLESLHISGLRSFDALCEILRAHSASLKTVRADYFVAGHETAFEKEALPIMPKLTSLALDVADVTTISASFALDMLNAIERPEMVTRLYLPHVEISGDSHDVSAVTKTLSRFTSLKQLVLRFGFMPVSVEKLIRMRQMDLGHLPAVCISDHFIVAMEKWAPWWPSIAEVWEKEDGITGLSVFHEQIDFEALGTSAAREWSKLSPEEQQMWEKKIAPTVKRLFVEARAKAPPREVPRLGRSQQCVASG